MVEKSKYASRKFLIVLLILGCIVGLILLKLLLWWHGVIFLTLVGLYFEYNIQAKGMRFNKNP